MLRAVDVVPTKTNHLCGLRFEQKSCQPQTPELPRVHLVPSQPFSTKTDPGLVENKDGIHLMLLIIGQGPHTKQSLP